jgi:tetratricopeptide (TPR) repeat protein
LRYLRYIILGRYEESIEAYDRVTEINPDDKMAWRSKGVALYLLGDHFNALKCLVVTTQWVEVLYTPIR